MPLLPLLSSELPLSWFRLSGPCWVGSLSVDSMPFNPGFHANIYWTYNSYSSILHSFCWCILQFHLESSQLAVIAHSEFGNCKHSQCPLFWQMKGWDHSLTLALPTLSIFQAMPYLCFDVHFLILSGWEIYLSIVRNCGKQVNMDS